MKRFMWVVSAPFASPRARLRAIWHYIVRGYAYEICLNCGRPVSRGTGPTWWRAPDWMWSRVNGRRDGVLCMACFARKAYALGYGFCWTVGGPDDE